MRPKLPPKKKRFWRISILLVVAATAVGGFMSFGPPGLYAKSGTPDFCASCHVMEGQYENWFHNAGHRQQKCIECHLPNDNMARHLALKGMTGMWDSFVFYSGKVPETIRISKHGASLVQENCQRCHAQTVSMINEDRNCWECHRRLSHRTTGTM